jgi:hypothetical protein
MGSHRTLEFGQEIVVSKKSVSKVDLESRHSTVLPGLILGGVQTLFPQIFKV